MPEAFYIEQAMASGAWQGVCLQRRKAWESQHVGEQKQMKVEEAEAEGEETERGRAEC